MTRDGDRWPAMRERFGVEHERQYGFDLPGEPIEIINLRATARRAGRRSRCQPLDRRGRRRPAGGRQVWIDADSPLECPVVRRSSLDPGPSLVGPAVIEEADSTTIVHPGDRVVVDASGALLITLGAGR